MLRRNQFDDIIAFEFIVSYAALSFVPLALTGASDPGGTFVDEYG